MQLDAQLMVMMSDVDGIYTAPPGRSFDMGGMFLIRHVSHIRPTCHKAFTLPPPAAPLTWAVCVCVRAGGRAGVREWVLACTRA